MSDDPTALAEQAKPKRWGRRRSGTATWHMSKEAVSLSLDEIAGWNDKQCLEFLVCARWGSLGTIVCPLCGTIAKHAYRPLEQRWKCAGCDSAFSLTSNTLFSHRKLPLKTMLFIAFIYINGTSGSPALYAKRTSSTRYNTTYVLQQKFREGYRRAHNVGFLSGAIEQDGSHQSGRRANEKRGKPQVTLRPVEQDDLSDLLTAKDRKKARKAKKSGVRNPQYGQMLPAGRRMLMTAVKRSGRRGVGAAAVRIRVAMSEDVAAVVAVNDEHVAVPESTLHTDSAPCYSGIGGLFQLHDTVEHSRELVGQNGESDNLAESVAWRHDRAERGIYLNIEPKYQADYGSETAFNENTRRMPNGEKLKIALHLALSCGRSQDWVGYTKGRHRDVELTCPKPRPAPASGPTKGRHPIASLNGRPPR